MNSPSFSQSHTMHKLVYPIMFIVFGIIAVSQYLEPKPIELLIFPLSIVALIMLTLNWVKLEYSISEAGITYRFRPFVKEKFIPAEEISAIHSLQISPLKVFGGWGFRFGRLGKAYTTGGKCILHIKPLSGKALNLTVANTEDFLTFAAMHKLPFTVSGERPL